MNLVPQMPAGTGGSGFLDVVVIKYYYGVLKQVYGQLLFKARLTLIGQVCASIFVEMS